MSSSKHSPIPQPSRHPSNLENIAEKLNEAAQALLDICHHPNDSAGSDEPEASLQFGSCDLKPPFEIRSYAIPDYILRDEQDLLTKTNAHDLHDALNKVYGHINSVVHLMQQYAAEEEMDGVIVNDLAEVLSVPLDWLELFCSTITGFRLVHHIKTE